jgi:hypothetical protein
LGSSFVSLLHIYLDLGIFLHDTHLLLVGLMRVMLGPPSGIRPEGGLLSPHQGSIVPDCHTTSAFFLGRYIARHGSLLIIFQHGAGKHVKPAHRLVPMGSIPLFLLPLASVVHPSAKDSFSGIIFGCFCTWRVPDSVRFACFPAPLFPRGRILVARILLPGG